MGDSQDKGDLLESVVAAMHNIPGVRVDSKTLLPGRKSLRQREIDVLVSSEVAGYPVRIAIECKNYKNKIGVNLMEAFSAKLSDVGIPRSHGVFVSVAGFTKPAQTFARAEGMRTLLLSGLSADRLAAVLNDALMTITYFVLYVDEYSQFPFLPDSAQCERLPNGVGVDPGSLNTWLWKEWVTRKIPVSPGEKDFHVRTSEGHTGASVVTRVVAYVGRIPGTAKRFQLLNPETSTPEKTRIEAEFALPTTVDLEALRDEEQIKQWAKTIESELHLVAQRIRVPRIITGALFWPPSSEAVARVKELRAQGEQVSFARVEGEDLSRAWEIFQDNTSPTKHPRDDTNRDPF